MQTLIASIAVALMLSVTPAMAGEQSIGNDEASEAEDGTVIPEMSGPSQELASADPSARSVFINCGVAANIAATNRVPTTIRNPFNVATSDCAVTLQCRLGSTPVALQQPLNPNNTLQSFSCGTNADRIVLIAEGTAGATQFEFVP
jgi:hypothetical protein